MSDQSAPQAGLHVLIVGAGIGGLSAAIALRQAGHRVEIFESSRFATEVGAAIHLPPNVTSILGQYGMSPEAEGANDNEWVTVYSSQGDVLSKKSTKDIKDIYGSPWQLIHRVDLHSALKRIATSPDGPGSPAVIHLRSKVVSCNPSEPSITLADDGQGGARIIRGDLVLGADGIHSTLRDIVIGDDEDSKMPCFPSGGSAFRFLVPIEKVRGNPVTKQLVERPGELAIWEGHFRRLIIYPCRHNTELNFVCLHPDTESQESTEGWNNSASVDQVLQIFSEFCAPMKTLLAMADPNTLKLWRLFDRGALNTWHSAYTALLGDAAHPFLPHQGQGGAQAIEDGAALGALLPSQNTTKEDIPARLELYMNARYERATMVQNFSRQMAFKTGENDRVGGFSMDPMEFSKVNFRHNAFEHAKDILREAGVDTP